MLQVLWDKSQDQLCIIEEAYHKELLNGGLYSGHGSNFHNVETLIDTVEFFNVYRDNDDHPLIQ